MALTKEPAGVAPQGIPHKGAPGQEYLDYKVKTNDSLESVAKRAGMTWEKLAEFNYGTKTPEEINWYLREYVGCTKETKDKNNYMFNSGDDPGIVHIPVSYTKPSSSDVNRAVKDNKQILSTLKSEPPTMEVQELAFPTGFTIKKWPTGPTLSKTVWKKAVKPHLPSAFVRGQTSGGTFKAKIKVKLLKGNHGDKTFSVRATGIASNGHTRAGTDKDAMTERIVLKKDTVTWAGDQNGEMEISDIGIADGQLPNRIMISTLPLCWAYSYDGKTWVNMGRTGPHLIYLVEANPDTKLSARPHNHTLFDLALAKACGYVNGDTNVALALCKAIPIDSETPKYDPNANLGETVEPLIYYVKSWCYCENFARLMVFLCHSIGVDAALTYIWGGEDKAVVLYTSKDGNITGVSFMTPVFNRGRAPKNPHFNFHAIAHVGGADYDPTYGTPGTTKATETAKKKILNKPPKDWTVDYPLKVKSMPLAEYNKIYAVTRDEGWICPHVKS